MKTSTAKPPKIFKCAECRTDAQCEVGARVARTLRPVYRYLTSAQFCCDALDLMVTVIFAVAVGVPLLGCALSKVLP